MPFTGSADNGAQRIASAFSTQQGLTPVIPDAGPEYIPENLRILAISRISIVVTQVSNPTDFSVQPPVLVPAGPPSTVEVWYSQRSQNPADFRYYGTIIIGALDFPEVFEFHISARLLQLRFQPALLDFAQYEWNVHGTGTS